MKTLIAALVTVAMLAAPALANPSGFPSADEPHPATSAYKPTQKVELPKPNKPRPVRVADTCSPYLNQCSKDSDCCSKNCVEISGVYACAMFGK